MQNEERINGLETQVRTLKRIVYGFGCLLVAGVVVSATSVQSVEDVIQAKEFQVVKEDVNGEYKVVVRINASDFGGALGILNMDEESVCSFAVYPKGGKLSISNMEGKTIANIAATEYGGTLSISNKDGKEVAAMFANPDGGGQMLTKNKKDPVTSQSP